MKPISIALSILGLVATLTPTPAGAQTASAPKFTSDELAALSAEFGSVLRFRQLGDATTLDKGRVDLGVQFASAPIDTSARQWNVTRFVGRFGVSDRVDIGAWGGYNSQVKDGMAGVDARIRLLTQGPSMPVSVAVRPNFSSTLGASDIWAASTGVDLSVSRTFGAFAPYGGIAATSSLATDRLWETDFERSTANQTLSYAGLAYKFGSVIAAVDVEKGDKVSYAFRLGARF
jgi:hypothetical protein